MRGRVGAAALMMMLGGCQTLPHAAAPQAAPDGVAAQTAQQQRAQALGLDAGDCLQPGWAMAGRMAATGGIFSSLASFGRVACGQEHGEIKGGDGLPKVGGVQLQEVQAQFEEIAGGGPDFGARHKGGFEHFRLADHADGEGTSGEKQVLGGNKLSHFLDLLE